MKKKKIIILTTADLMHEHSVTTTDLHLVKKRHEGDIKEKLEEVSDVRYVRPAYRNDFITL